MSTVWEHVATLTERVVVGRGAVARIGDLCDSRGMSRVVVVTGRTLATRTPVVATVEAVLGSRRVATFAEAREHTPRSAVERLRALLDEERADGVVSVGGGSPIDAAKVAIADRDGGATPHLAVPTTLSGSEHTAIAGVTDDTTRIKRGVAGPRLAPWAVVLDADQSRFTPQWLWLSTGIRALDHAVETVYAPERDDFARQLTLEAIRRLRRLLPASHADPDDLDVRQGLLVAAWWATPGLGSLTLAPSHPLGRLLGPLAGIGHGITSCLFLPPAIAWVARRHPERLRALIEVFEVATPADVAQACRQLVADLGLPTRLADAGVADAVIAQLEAMIPPEWVEVVEEAR